MQHESIIFKKIRGINNTMLIVGLIGLLTVIGFVVVSSGPYWLAQLNAPQMLTASEIFELQGTERLYNRAVTGLEMKDTYYYEESYDEDTGDRIRIDAYFGALHIGKDLWMLVRSPDEINTRTEAYVGTIQPIKDDIAVDVASLAADEMRIDFLPVMLDTTRSEVMWYVGTAVLVVVGLVSLSLMIAAIGRSRDPYRHPILKKLSRLGNADDVIHNVEKDLSQGAESIGKLRLTRSYVVYESNNGFDVFPYEQLAWIYKMVINGRYGMKTYQARICDITGHEVQIAAKEKDVHAMLAALAERAPWAIAGYSDEIKRAWSKDRQQFLAEVAKRRRSYAPDDF